MVYLQNLLLVRLRVVLAVEDLHTHRVCSVLALFPLLVDDFDISAECFIV